MQYLDSKWLKQNVTVSHELKGHTIISEQSVKLESLTRERVPLYLRTRSSRPRSGITYDTLWVQNISVREIQEIQKCTL